MSDVLFTAHATAKGGRRGHVKSESGLIDHDLSMPSDDTDKKGTNPEELFAAGYAACFDGALNVVASKKKKEIETSITADVNFMKDPDDNGFKIGVVLNAEVNGVSQEEAEDLVEAAHQFCPYSKATRGNIEVKLNAKAV
ncbi:organic hydroperoxide resistance protein [Alkalihalobacillus sp. AL-G]|uniref:organic hydroperoxide resistance protein n=1 Tax=Alkalihalobacillus sp. AL-G TaxID=2926399 RepID=UPI00272A3B28|nr:organic hydroperoxide resistance protein [Alkalihalobacillus sp. AL-G]WLD92521.1 organic hydroperoxide resistance protein [Alkalihalobacillus sp. AL-G]